jgi:hypothetical protein
LTHDVLELGMRSNWCAVPFPIHGAEDCPNSWQESTKIMLAEQAGNVWTFEPDESHDPRATVNHCFQEEFQGVPIEVQDGVSVVVRVRVAAEGGGQCSSRFSVADRKRHKIVNRIPEKLKTMFPVGLAMLTNGFMGGPIGSL